MSYYTTFLETNIDDHKELNKNFKNAAMSLYAKEHNLDFYDVLFSGDANLNQKINTTSLTPCVEHVVSPEHLQNVSQQWLHQGYATLFRGTRLVDESSSFKLNGFHATPQIDVAMAYGNGTVNTSTGIGHIFSKVGFVNSYDVPLKETTYRSFEFEDIIAHNEEKSNKTLEKFVHSISSLVQNPSLFERQGDQFSAGEKEVSQLMRDNYECILSNEKKASQQFIIIDQKLLTINLDNPEWQQLLARHQEISLRHFYEINPLEKILKDIEQLENNIDHPIHQHSQSSSIFKQLKEQTTYELEKRKSAPWEATTLNDIKLNNSPYVSKRSYITDSSKVGASNGATIRYPSVIEQLQQTCEYLSINDYDKVVEHTKKNHLNIETGNSSIENNIEKKPQYLLLTKVFDQQIIINLRSKYNNKPSPTILSKP